MNRVPEQLWPRLLTEAWAALDPSGPPDPSALTDSPAAGDPSALADLLARDAGGAGRLPAGLEVAGLEVAGPPGRLPSRLPVEDTAIACAGAALLAAAAWQVQRDARGGRPGPVWPAVRLDRGHVAAAFRSEAHVRLGAAAAPAGFAPLSRFWRAADGWVRTHANYPWHREALLRALGTTDDPESVAAVVAGLGAREVEDRVVGAGGVAAAVRTEAGWLAEPAGQAVAAARLIEGGNIGAAPPRPHGAWAAPASDVRVLDLTRVIAGPVATRYLAALGADVLRLDSPHLPELPLQAYCYVPF